MQFHQQLAEQTLLSVFYTSRQELFSRAKEGTLHNPHQELNPDLLSQVISVLTITP